MRTILIPLAALALMALPAVDAAAQTSPMTSATTPSPSANPKMMPSSPGTKRGLHQLNNSGQVGTATVHPAGENASEVVLEIKSIPAGATQLAGLLRYPPGDCDTFPHGTVTFKLNPVSGTGSTTTVPISADRLLSGNYLVVIYSKEQPDHYFTCGRLFNR